MEAPVGCGSLLRSPFRLNHNSLEPNRSISPSQSEDSNTFAGKQEAPDLPSTIRALRAEKVSVCLSISLTLSAAFARSVLKASGANFRNQALYKSTEA